MESEQQSQRNEETGVENQVDENLNEENVESKKRPAPCVEDVETECSICCDKWTNSGPHRIVSLKCGHLYGKSCIERWMKERNTCPSCKTKVKRKDIRHIYTSAIAVEDTSSRDAAETARQAERYKRIQADAGLALSDVRYKILEEKHKKLGEHLERVLLELNELKSRVAPVVDLTGPDEEENDVETTSQEETPVRYEFVAKINTCQSRIFDLSTDAELACVGTKHPSNGTYGFAKISIDQPRHATMIQCHTAPVRDIAINRTHSTGTLVLTTSLDGTIKVTSLRTDAPIIEYKTPRCQGWSCSWDQVDSNYFYCGCTGGKIFQYDMRQTRESIRSMQCDLQQPIHSLHAVVGTSGQAEVFAGSFNAVTHWTGFDQFAVHTSSFQLPFTGTCMSMGLDQMKQTLVLSSRDVGDPPIATHAVVDRPEFSAALSKSFSNVRTSKAHRAASPLARTAIWTRPGSAAQAMIASGDAITRKLILWTAGTNEPFQEIDSTPEPIVDVQHVVRNGVWSEANPVILAALSSSNFKLYKWK